MAEVGEMVSPMTEIIPYIPEKRARPARYLEGWPTAWHPNEDILQQLLYDFNVKRGIALEFGSEHGHSAIALSNFFDKVICVDPWMQQITDQSKPMYDVVRENVSRYPNIILVRETWQEFCKPFRNGMPHWLKADLIHIDAEHNYQECYGNGLWACENAPVVIFHDTVSFPEVSRAVSDLAEKFHRKFYEFQEGWGLGILA